MTGEKKPEPTRGEPAGREQRAYVALGSNLGDRLGALQGAVDQLAREPRISVVGVSRVYETAPVGGPVQDDYLNAVIAIDTDLDPWQLLDRAQRCEADASRVRAERWGPRTLDVDILIYDDARIDDARLTIPHPRMQERGFVLAPLRDLDPDLVDGDGPWPGVQVASVALEPPPAV